MKIRTPFVLAILATAFATAAAPPETPPERPLRRPAGMRMDASGPLRAYLDAVTTNWLLPAPKSNPAMLAMFADRDRQPYRNLLPWSGEFAGKYLTGASQVYQATHNPELGKSLREFVRALLPLQDADGYFGPFPKEHRLTGSAPNIDNKPGPTWDAWGHYHMMIGLLTWDEAVGDPDALGAAVKIADLLCNRYLGEKRPRMVDAGSTEMNLAPAHALMMVYEKTRQPKYLELAKQVVAEFAAVGGDGKPVAGDYLRRGLADEPFYKTPKPRWESLHPMEALAALGRVEADADARKAFANLWWSIAELDRHDNGGFSSGEQAQGDPYHQGAIETCCTIAWLALTADMLKQSGDPVTADELELSTLNSALGMFSPSGRWSTYNTPMDGVRLANYHEIVFQSRPGSPDLNCCSVNAARGIGLVSQWALLSDDDGVMILNWYGAGRLSGRLKGGASVGFEAETDYPASGRVRIKVRLNQPTTFPLALRIPQWSTATKVNVAGKAEADVKPATYHKINREWKDGDVVEIDLDMTPRAWVGEKASAGRSALYAGPVLLTYDPRLNDNGPDDPEPIDARSVKLVPASSWKGSYSPIVLAEARTTTGKMVKLCDFATAGADGSRYRSWLRVENVAATPFSHEHTFRTGPATAPAPAAASAPHKAKRPNVLLILADDMGFSDLGCFGGEIATPNLDRLAANGLRYSQFYNTARCWPSRAAIMTGYYAQQVNRDPARTRPGWAALLPQLLKPAGYRAYHSGKWHIDGPVLAGGFERSYLSEDYDRHFTPRKHKIDDKPLPPVKPGDGYYSTTAIADHAVEWIAEHETKHKDDPFLLYLAFIAPHFPIQAPRHDIDRYRTRYLEGWDALREARRNRQKELGLLDAALSPRDPKTIPSWNLPEAELLKRIGPGEAGYAVAWESLTSEQKAFHATKMAIHAAMVDRLDREVGKVLAKLEAAGMMDDTLILFASDNGASAEEIIRGDGHDPNAPAGADHTFLSLGPGWSTASNTPFRLHKSWNHEGGVATPLIAHWPARITSKGQFRRAPGHLIDVAPTLLELAGLSAPESWEGRPRPSLPGKSLVPTFDADVPVSRDVIFFKHEKNKGLRRGDWKIVAAGQNAPWELYDLAVDRTETRNLAAEKPELVRDLAETWGRLDREYQEQGASGGK